MFRAILCMHFCLGIVQSCTETLTFESGVFGYYGTDYSKPPQISFDFDISSAYNPASINLTIGSIWGEFDTEDAQVFVDDTLIATCSPSDACSDPNAAQSGGTCISTPMDVAAFSQHPGNHLQLNLTYVGGGNSYFCDAFKASASLVVVNTLLTCPPTPSPTPTPSLSPVFAPSAIPTPLPTSTRPSAPPTSTPTLAPSLSQIEFRTYEVVDSCASDGCTLDYEFVLGRDALAEVDASPDWTSAFLTVAEVEGDINHEAEYLTIRVNDLVVGTCLNGDLNCEEPGKGFLSDGEQCCNPQSCMSRIDVTSFLVPGATKAKVDVTGSDMVNDGDCGNHAFKLKAKFFLILVAPVTHPPSPIPTAPSPRPTLLPTPPPSSLVAVDTPGVATPSSSEPVVSCPDLTASSSSSASSSVALEELTWITSVASACPSAQLFLFEGTSTYRSTLSGVLPNSQGSGLFEWDVGATVQALSSTSSFVLCGTSSLTLKLRCTGGGRQLGPLLGAFHRCLFR